MKRKLSVVACAVAALLVLSATATSAYKLGLTRNDAFEALKLMAFAQHQQQCVADQNMDCVAKSQRILMRIVAGELQRADLQDATASEKQKVEAFLKEERALGH